MDCGSYRREDGVMRTALYRHYDKHMNLLYVGISLSATRRLGQHMSLSHWSDAIAHVRVEYFDTHEAAYEAETKAIRSENPKHNIAKRATRETERDAEEGRRKRLSRIRLGERIVQVDPLYEVAAAAKTLGMNKPKFLAVCKAYSIKPFLLPDDNRSSPPRYVTGWQILDMLELLEAA